MSPKVVILSAVRTPVGAIGGGLSALLPTALGAIAVREALTQAKVTPTQVDYTTLGWVMQDPRSPNIARFVSDMVGIPCTSPGTTVHENCASGGAAVHDIARRLLLGEIRLGVAGGVESMSNVPRFLYGSRLGGKMYGDLSLVDGLMGALTDPTVGPKGELMGLLTERLVQKYGVTRAEQDEVALRSHQRACAAWDGGFLDYVTPVTVPAAKPHSKQPPTIVQKDEGPRPHDAAYFAKQKPYFLPEKGTITAANASSLNDGAAALVLSTDTVAAELGLTPLAELKAFHNVGVPKELMGEGAFKVIPPLLRKGSLAIGDVDYFELNEAFAAVVGAAFHDLPDLKPEKVNPWGSGVSLGHPVGCTGARQLVDMVHQLRKRDKAFGVTTRCVGGGMGSGEVLARWS